LEKGGEEGFYNQCPCYYEAVDIRTNPVKKDLSENPEDYPWLYEISL
jgi:hypothetical protein